MESDNEMSEEGDRYSARRRDAQLQDAAEWLAQWKSGSVDEAAFARWRAADPSHELAFARVASAWEAATAGAHVLEHQDSPAQTMTRRRLMQGGMAGAVLLAGGSGLIATRAYAWDSLATKVGETRKLRLADDSVIAMNTDSKLFWRISRSKREFWLARGEVAIDLHPGPETRLRTDVDAAQVDAGRYNVRLRNEALDLLVLRGQATGLGKSGQSLIATPFHRLSFEQGGALLTPASSAAVDAALAWQNGEILFLDTPLAQAAAEYNRYLTRKIVIDNPAVGATPVAGRFLSTDPADFLRAISAGLGLRVRTTDTAYHIDQ